MLRRASPYRTICPKAVPIYFRFRIRGSIDQRFFDGSFLRLVEAKSSNCFSDIDSAICFEAPFRLLIFCSPRFAERAAPAAICCFLDFAGIFIVRVAELFWSLLPMQNLKFSHGVGGSQ